MKRSHLETKEQTIQRVWTVEDIPVLQASVALPEPQPAKDAAARRIHFDGVYMRQDIGQRALAARKG